MVGDPKVVKALVLPMHVCSWQKVKETLHVLHQSGLIQIYDLFGEVYLYAPTFDKHQQGLHKRTQSRFPEPPGLSGGFPPNGTEQKGTEEEEKVPHGTVTESFTEKQRAGWAAAFPGAPLEAEWVKAKAWMSANPHRPKKRLASFFHNWLTNWKERQPKPAKRPVDWVT